MVLNKKIVDYSQFGDLEDDDEDFAVPSSKKSRTQLKEPKKEKKEKQKKPHELIPLQKQIPSKRMSLDDKLYQRDLEVALALSVKGKSANNLEVQNSEGQDETIESENVHRRPTFSNCSVDSELLGLNQVMDDDVPRGDCRQRTAASKVPAQQKKLRTVDSDDGENATDSEPESVPSEESEEYSDYTEDDDIDFAMEKKKVKGNKKKTRQNMSAEREKKTPKSKINATGSPVVSSSRTMEQKSEPTQKMTSSSLEPVGRPLHTSSPVTDKKPKWIPPAASGSSNNNSMKYVSIKSPTRCLRLGLSRLARVKPLHPSATSKTCSLHFKTEEVTYKSENIRIARFAIFPSIAKSEKGMHSARPKDFMNICAGMKKGTAED
ncbi:RAD51-associated protein 1 [Patagioenas fasciata monilis]|uniref:RAD51-associated protein 1 n=1 Tax=Patagioenas fasciata monilis TaxID=372326 RepID=A0A1V4K878_PATFA|nr:RAD51-associated protein 1 [Patagioenas fasciata monilis]